MEKLQNQVISPIIKGGGIALLTSFIFLIVFAVILACTEVSENTIPPVIIIITGISVLISSIIGTRRMSKNGLLNGGLVGLIYILIIYFISSILNGNFSLNIQSIIMIVVAIIFGMIGGIIGINKKYLQ